MKYMEQCLKLANAYQQLAWMNLASQLYVTCEQEQAVGLTDDVAAAALEAAETICGLVAREDADTLSAARDLRERLTDLTNAYTVFADRLQICEYLLNRKEYSFRKDLAEKDVEAEVRGLLQELFATEDNAAVNLRIQLVLQQLPVRMTKARFMDLVSNSFRGLLGAPEDVVREYGNRLLHGAGILCEDDAPLAPALEEKLEKLLELTLRGVLEHQLDEAKELLEELENKVLLCMETLVSTEKLLNAAMCIAYINGIAFPKGEASLVYGGPVQEWLGVMKDNLSGVPTAVSEESLACFGWMEGRLESCSEEIVRLESVLLDEKQAASVEWMDTLRIASALMSTSDFAPLVTEPSAIVTEGALLESIARVTETLSQAMEGRDRKWIRAMMAGVLKELPVFFDSRTELMEYMLNALRQCTDAAERTASIDLLWAVFSEQEV